MWTMESSEPNRILPQQTSSTDSTYYSGQKYYNSSSNHTPNIDKYGSFQNNRKHFRNKRTKSLDTLSQSHSDNTPYSEYTPNPYYSLLSNASFSSSMASIISLDPNDFLINSKDDISVDSHQSDLDSNHNNEDNGVHLVDSSSNCSFGTMDSSKIAVTASSIMDKIMNDNDYNSHHPLLGMTLVTLSAIGYALLNLSVKLLMYSSPWTELMFIRMAITWICTTIWIFVQFRGKLSLFGPKHQRLLLLLRAFFLWGAMFTCWWSFEFLPVGDGTTLAMSFPVWVSVFAHFVWKNDASSQRLDIFGWICVLCGLLGIVFVAQPSFIFGHSAESDEYHNRDVGICIGMASAICAGAQYVIVNYTKKDCHWLQVEQITSALSTFILCPLGSVAFALYDYRSNDNKFVIQWDNLNGVAWAEEVALGLLGFISLALLTRGSQLDAPHRTAICLYLEIPFVYIGQCAITDSFPDAYVFVGIFLVLCSVIIPAIRKMKRSGQENRHSTKYREKNRRKDSIEELVPLIGKDGHALFTNRGYNVSGVTVDWSSEEDSSQSIELDGYD